jgi:hypothetical protein
VQGFQRHGEAGLVGSDQLSPRQAPKVDDRWVETALEVMGEHKEESKPSRTLVIERTNARAIARVVRVPRGAGRLAQRHAARLHEPPHHGGELTHACANPRRGGDR